MEDLGADDLRWELEYQPPVEAIDVLTLTESETVSYVRELQRECATLRTLLREVLAVAVSLTRRVEQYRIRLAALLAAQRQSRSVDR
jgi:hypothetical protein